MSAEFPPSPVVAGCSDDTCEPCSERAVLGLSGAGSGRAAGGSGSEEISIAPLPAEEGGIALVHAGEAIAIVGE